MKVKKQTTYIIEMSEEEITMYDVVSTNAIKDLKNKAEWHHPEENIIKKLNDLLQGA